MTSLGTMFYRLLVASAFVILLINGVPNNALRNMTLISGVGNVNPPRTMTEPASLLLMGTCLAGIGAKMRRRAKKA